jgi:hypothetical protein
MSGDQFTFWLQQWRGVMSAVSAVSVKGSLSHGAAIICRVAIVTGLVGRLALAAEVEGEPDEALKQEILDAMHRRAEAAKSFVFEWTQSPSPIDEEGLKARMSIATNSQVAEEAEMARRSALAMVALHLGGNYRLVVDDSKIGFELLTQQPVRDDPRKLVARESIAVFDGKVCRDVALKSFEGYPEAYVSSENDTGGFDVPESLPIAIALHGSTEIAGYAGTATNGRLDERPLIVLRLEPPEPRRIGYTLWCDPEKDYHAIRIEKRFDAILSASYDVAYERDKRSDQWVPVRWVLSSWAKDGTRYQSKTNEVTHYEIGTAIPAEELQVEFPVGTYIHDMVKNEEFILLKGGERRVVTKTEQSAGLTYQELMQSLNRPSKDGPNQE